MKLSDKNKWQKVVLLDISFSLETVYSDTIEASIPPEGVLQSHNEIFEDSGNFVTSDFRGWLNRQPRREIHAKGDRSRIPWGLPRKILRRLNFQFGQRCHHRVCFLLLHPLNSVSFQCPKLIQQIPPHSNLVKKEKTLKLLFSKLNN